MTPSVPVTRRPDPAFHRVANLNQLTREKTEMKTIKNFLKDESGMETLEYAVIAGLIAAVAILVYASGWGTALSTRLNAATTTG